MRPARTHRSRRESRPDEGPTAWDRVDLKASFVEWFDYTEVVGREAEPPRPALTFVLEAARRRLRASGLFDSGSDRSFLPAELARRLGIMPGRADSSVEIMGTVVPTGSTKVTIEIPSRAGHARIEAVEFLVPMPPVDLPFVILGREPAFEHFEVRFREWEHRFGLLPRSHPQARAGRISARRSRSLTVPVGRAFHVTKGPAVAQSAALQGHPKEPGRKREGAPNQFRLSIMYHDRKGVRRRETVPISKSDREWLRAMEGRKVAVTVEKNTLVIEAVAAPRIRKSARA